MYSITKILLNYVSTLILQTEFKTSHCVRPTNLIRTFAQKNLNNTIHWKPYKFRTKLDYK